MIDDQIVPCALPAPSSTGKYWHVFPLAFAAHHAARQCWLGLRLLGRELPFPGHAWAIDLNPESLNFCQRYSCGAPELLTDVPSRPIFLSLLAPSFQPSIYI